MALTKADMAEHLFDELGLNKREAKDLIESFIEEIRTALGRGEEVKLSGFVRLCEVMADRGRAFVTQCGLSPRC
ncbi:hypothetical protein THSYN_29660 (plasmid) [Candidatus Thiodictyon syntrophicum]|jgi:nucleoid DNA-binding protein|uniref:Integration host factor subunit alpha n=1 Tax=Candidatus Thiodictyon syntrophicum TaxID=1166950 RepID=A0A2K8UHY8_9GAMM|nr:hypothetical protein THSYN_29660 [Candidatus Thiodictyon syntrophicum]